MKPELIQEALERDWRLLWLPVAIDVPSEEVEIQPCRCLPLTGTDASGSNPSLLEGLAAGALRRCVFFVAFLCPRLSLFARSDAMGKLRKMLSAPGLLATIGKRFRRVPEHRAGSPR